jgi:hypothetical protein
MRSFVPALLLLSTAGCSSSSPPTPVDLAFPRVRVDATGVFLDGQSIAPPLEDKREKIDLLFQKLKTQREDWKTAHPNEKFEGRVDIEISPGISCNAALGAMTTSAFAGYTTFKVRSGSTLLEVPAAVPGPPSPEPVPGDKNLPLRTFLNFHTDGTVDLQPTLCGGVFDTVPAEGLASAAKDLYAGAANGAGPTLIQCDANMPFEKVLPALLALRRISPQMRIGGGFGRCTADPLSALDTLEDSAGMLLGDFALTWRAPAALDPDRKRPFGEIRVLDGPAGGALDPAVVKAAVGARSADVTACYERGLLANPNLQGRTLYRLALGRKGTVMRVKTDVGDMPDSRVNTCVAGALTLATFPARTGDPIEVGVTITFDPRPEGYRPPKKK